MNQPELRLSRSLRVSPLSSATTRLHRHARSCALTLALVSPLVAWAGGKVTGRVVDAATGKYLQGAEVSVNGTQISATTQRDGTFVLTDVPAGSQQILVSYIGLDNQTASVQVTEGGVSPVEVKMASETVVLEAFTVSTPREGMAEALNLQRVSIQTKAVAAGDQFGPVMEGNVGEYLKFMPGVSIDYNVNDARGVSLRGLNTAWTIVAVDGTAMAGASSVDDTRRFEFEQIAMNNVEQTELFKTVTPDIPATATGGYVNFVTKSAFDFQESQRINYDLAISTPSTNLSYGKRGGLWGSGQERSVRPNLEVNFGRKITEKLGINFNYRLSEKYDDSPRTEFTWNTSTPTSTSPSIFTTPRLQQYNIRTEQKLTHREAFATKLDYKFSDRTRLAISGQWNWYDLNFTQRGPQFVLGTAGTASGNTFTSGATGASIQNGVLYRRKYGTTLHFNSTLSHTFANEGKLTVTPYWSHADGQYRDASNGFVSAVASMAPSSTTYTNFVLADPMTLGVLPTITLNRGTTAVPLDFLRSLGNYTLSNTVTGSNIQSRPWTAKDTKKGVRADFSQPLDLKLPVTLQTGIAFDDTKRTIDRPDIRGAVTALTGSALTALADSYFDRDVAYGFGSIQVLDTYKVYNALKGNLTAFNNTAERKIEEKNRAAYLRADVNLRKDLILVAGARWEKRDIAATGLSGAPGRAKSTTANLDQSAVYPSTLIKYTPRRDIAFRAGFSQTIGIPDYGEILPTFVTASTTGGTDGTISVPDSDLKPYKTNNYDVSVEYYFRNKGVVSLSLFRKDISNYVISRIMTADERSAVLAEYGLNPNDFGATAGTIRENGSKSSVQGFEVSASQNFSKAPGILKGLNLQANFTYTDVSAKDSDPYRALDTEYSQLRAVSPKTANFIVGYRIGRFNTTITNNWVSESLYGGFVSTNYVVGTANTVDPTKDTRLALYKDEKFTTDFKVEYSFNPRISIYGVVRNVFNSARKEYAQGYLPQNRGTVLPLRYFEFGEPNLTIGVRGTF